MGSGIVNPFEMVSRSIHSALSSAVRTTLWSSRMRDFFSTIGSSRVTDTPSTDILPGSVGIRRHELPGVKLGILRSEQCGRPYCVRSGRGLWHGLLRGLPFADRVARRGWCLCSAGIVAFAPRFAWRGTFQTATLLGCGMLLRAFCSRNAGHSAPFGIRYRIRGMRRLWPLPMSASCGGPSLAARTV